MRAENGNAKLYIQHDFNYINISQGQACVCVAYGKNRMSDSKERGPMFSMAVFGLWDCNQFSFHYLQFSASSSCYTGTCTAVAIKKIFLHRDSGFERK